MEEDDDWVLNRFRKEGSKKQDEKVPWMAKALPLSLHLA